MPWRAGHLVECFNKCQGRKQSDSHPIEGQILKHPPSQPSTTPLSEQVGPQQQTGSLVLEAPQLVLGKDGMQNAYPHVSVYAFLLRPITFQNYPGMQSSFIFWRQGQQTRNFPRAVSDLAHTWECLQIFLSPLTS